MSHNPDEAVWYAKNANRMTHPKGLKKANEHGIYDMSGMYLNGIGIGLPNMIKYMQVILEVLLMKIEKM